jgi:nicotinamide-nucleotide amidase
MNATLTVAESCTGGFLGHRLTNVPGASEVFWGGLLVYSNEAKSKLAGVSPKTLEQFGAVSRETAIELAQGAKAAANADYAISITGIAGPGGGSTEKPVGLVYIGLATPDGVSVLERINTYDRETFKLITTQQALDLLRTKISK